MTTATDSSIESPEVNAEEIQNLESELAEATQGIDQQKLKEELGKLEETTGENVERKEIENEFNERQEARDLTFWEKVKGAFGKVGEVLKKGGEIIGKCAAAVAKHVWRHKWKYLTLALLIAGGAAAYYYLGPVLFGTSEAAGETVQAVQEIGKSVTPTGGVESGLEEMIKHGEELSETIGDGTQKGIDLFEEMANQGAQNIAGR